MNKLGIIIAFQYIQGKELVSAKKDIYIVKKYLKKNGYEIIIVSDIDALADYETFVDFVTTFKPENKYPEVFLYYSGHGVKNQILDSNNFFLNSFLKNGIVRFTKDDSKIIIITDCCNLHKINFLSHIYDKKNQKWIDNEQKYSLYELDKKFFTKKRKIIFFVSSSGYSIIKGGNSIFTHKFFKCIENDNTIKKLLDETEYKDDKYHQIPRVYANEYYFINKINKL